ncbi:unnamed protein product [Bathycoccus prasinos]
MFESPTKYRAVIGLRRTQPRHSHATYFQEYSVIKVYTKTETGKLLKTAKFPIKNTEMIYEYQRPEELQKHWRLVQEAKNRGMPMGKPNGAIWVHLRRAVRTNKYTLEYLQENTKTGFNVVPGIYWTTSYGFKCDQNSGECPLCGKISHFSNNFRVTKHEPTGDWYVANFSRECRSTKFIQGTETKLPSFAFIL